LKKKREEKRREEKRREEKRRDPQQRQQHERRVERREREKSLCVCIMEFLHSVISGELTAHGATPSSR